MSGALSLVGWLLCAVMGGTVLARVSNVDVRSTYMIGASTALPLVLLGALPVLGLALVRGQRWLAVVAAVLSLVQLLVTAPLAFGSRHAPPRDRTGTPLRVFALNVEYDKDTGAAVSRLVGRESPDVVVLSELSPLTLRELDLAQYPYSVINARTDAFGEGVWSRYPLALTHAPVNGVTMLAGTVDVDGRRIALSQVHTMAPRDATGRALWRAELHALAQRSDGSPGPAILAGDFNASRTDAPFRRLGRQRGLIDAGSGRGYAATWPADRWFLPPLLPLDHVLCTPDIRVAGFRVLPAVGSDHRPVLADLVIPA